MLQDIGDRGGGRFLQRTLPALQPGRGTRPSGRIPLRERSREQGRVRRPLGEEAARVQRVGDELRPRGVQVVVVEERLRSAAGERRQQVQAGETLDRAEVRYPPLDDRVRRARLDLEAEREHDERERRAVRLDLAPQLPHLLEEALERVPHAGRVRVAEEALDRVDLAPFRVHQQPDEREALVERKQPAGRAREVVVELGDVVEADREHRLVGAVVARDALPGDALLAGGPAPERDAHHLGAPALRGVARFEQLRVRLPRRQLGPERHAVAEERDAHVALGLLARPRAVAQPVAVELLPGRPADAVGLHHVEAARHLVVPVPDVVGHLGPRRPLPLDEPRAAFEHEGRERRGTQSEREVLRELARLHAPKLIARAAGAARADPRFLARRRAVLYSSRSRVATGALLGPLAQW